jgi:hypothetical protein
MPIKVVFNDRPPTRGSHLCEAEVHFAGPEFGPLSGLKLTGFRIYPFHTKDAGFYCTLPARAFGTGETRGYLDFVEPIGKHDDGKGDVRDLKSFIVAAWMRYRSTLKEVIE